MATAGEVLSVIQEVEAVSNTILTTVSALDPSLALPTAAIQEIEGLANAALKALTTAQGVGVITVAEVQALIDPLTIQPPTA